MSAASNTSDAIQEELQRLRQRVAELEPLEQQLRDAQDLLRATFDHVPYAITVMDVTPEGALNYVQSNPATLRMLGVSGSDRSDIDPNFDPDTQAAVVARFIACRDGGVPLEFEEQLRAGNRTIWTQAMYTPSPAPDGVSTRVVITSFDVTERKMREQEALSEREAIIEQQSLTLAEISTPLLSISDHVVVLPLIGAIDSRRAQQIMDALLTGIATTSARVAILDITGVAVVDTQVANVLIRSAQAVKLLGAQVVLTGIRPEVAQTLVGLGIDLSGILTRSTLQAGIATSLSR